MGDVVRHAHAVQSAIQQEMGVAVVKIGFATGGHSRRTRRQHVVLYLTQYLLTEAQSTAQLALFVRVNVAVFHKTIETFVACESRANLALAQARPNDALHLTSYMATLSKKPPGVLCACSL